MEVINKIYMIWGDKCGRFPFSNSLYIDDKIKIIIDTGAGYHKYTEFNGEIDLIINSHYHLDHIRYNYLFSNAEIIIHESDISAMQDLNKFAKTYGGELAFGSEWIDKWEKEISSQANKHSSQGFVYESEYFKSIGKVHNTYSSGDKVSCGNIIFEIVHTPGHSAGHCSFFFPEQNLCFATDYNVGGSFGPWYGGEDSDIDLLIQSAKKLIDLDAKYYINSHDQQIYYKKDFSTKLEEFLEVIEVREKQILDLIEKGYSVKELCSEGIIYSKKYLYLEWVKIWETVMIIKHLNRLEKKGILMSPLTNSDGGILTDNWRL